MSEWQTIDSVRKDGKPIIVWVGQDDVAGPHCFAPISITEEGWWWDDATGEQIEPIPHVTHWMDAPEPPK